MNEGSARLPLLQISGKGGAKIAQPEKLRGRNAVGVRGDVAVKNLTRAVRKTDSQMVIGPAVAQAQLQNRPGQPAQISGCSVNTRALRLHAADKGIKTAHGLGFSKVSQRRCAAATDYPASCSVYDLATNFEGQKLNAVFASGIQTATCRSSWTSFML